jgi:hypothetical protein
MTFKYISLAAATLLASSALQAATIQNFQIQGQFDTTGLSIHNSYDNTFFSGAFSFDLDNRVASSNPFYELSSWNISLEAGGVLASTGEAFDSGRLTLDRINDRIQIVFGEDIDNPATATEERRTLQVYFDAPFDLLPSSTFEDVLAADANFGSAANFQFGSIQFSTSQFPQGIGTATVTTSAVPIPAAAWLFGSGLLGLISVARRRWL